MINSRNIKLEIQYDGTNYHGWQKQKNGNTIQASLERALEGLLGHEIDLIGCSRTDQGVHALSYIANFYTTSSSIPAKRLSLALKPYLPVDISVIGSEEVSLDFHARHQAKSKIYIYKIYNQSFKNPLLNNRAYHVNRPLDIEKMQEAANHIIGSHEYDAFMAQGSYVESTKREIFYTRVRENETIDIEVCGDGFLYKMARTIAGTLIYVGLNKIQVNDIEAIIKSKDRKRAGISAPAHGLYLTKVNY